MVVERQAWFSGLRGYSLVPSQNNGAPKDFFPSRSFYPASTIYTSQLLKSSARLLTCSGILLQEIGH